MRMVKRRDVELELVGNLRKEGQHVHCGDCVTLLRGRGHRDQLVAYESISVTASCTAGSASPAS